jgi:hypothetical protein
VLHCAPTLCASVLTLACTSFTSAASLLAAPLDTVTSLSLDSDVRRAATSWHTAASAVAPPEAVAGADDDADVDDDAGADDGALPALEPLDPQPLASSTPATKTATIRHHANLRPANRLIAILIVCLAVSRPSLPVWRALYIVRAG